jgi:flagellin-like protein
MKNRKYLTDTRSVEKAKMDYKKFRKNAKALSPVIATIILIAVTVAVSVVVAAWMGALTIGFMGKSEQASITNVALTNLATTGCENATVTVQNTGSATVTITSATIDSSSVQLLNSAGKIVTSVAVAKGTSVTFGLGATGQFANTAQYTIKLMTAKGNTVTTQATYSGS